VAAVLVLVGSFFVASAMFKGSDAGGSQINAPTLTGRTFDDATATAHNTSSKLTVTKGEAIPCGTVAKDLVCQQSPAAGTKMSQSGTITVQLSSGPGQSPVPSVTGQPSATATKALTDAGFQVGSPQYASDDTVPQDSVISQNPPAGTKADPGTTVTLTISQGPNKSGVPNVVGQTVDVATSTLEQAGFTVDASKTVPSTDPTKPVGTVATQNPPANAKQPKGAKITLTVYAAPTKTQIPDLSNRTVKDATAALKAAGFTAWTFSGPSDDKALVVTTSPGPNQLVDPNTNIQITTRPGDTKGTGGTIGFPPIGGATGQTP
jgi:serine/threonine-protein kinase